MKKRISLRYIASLVFVLTLGILPSLLFFVWIERNCTLPWIPKEFGWPWVFVDGTLLDTVLWNGLLIFSFGFVHTLMAQLRFPRALFMVITGLHTLLIMSLWQNTGIVLYQLIPHAGLSSFISFTLFWSLIGIGAKAGMPFDLPAFVALKPKEKLTESSTKSTTETPAAKKNLVTTGWYGSVRHPMYFLTIGAFILTPFMTVDRLIVLVCSLLYLAVGIPFEEKKLIREFGDDYRNYRKMTPALFPRLRS